MIDLIKKTLLAGVGAAVVTKEKVEDTLHDFVRQGKVSAGDARIMAEKIAEQGRREFEDVSEKLTARFKELTARESSVLKDRVATLEQRIAALEARLNNESAPAETPTRNGEP
ncbi:hypothetical protein Ga0100231_006565 [Opitutaceae bacterium TAV4]|uniref:phasin family protein n=1 Tax=Geminisphaera colitermitum TaxID=1148786 RepID=UPI000158C9EB|nr:hypothetical protein [Geminisphaera colitermitum]RRJ98061.1 hypothetical protein Ga0100231_006565 [Opitutaceae bacterium TAV4]RRK02649.1 hypothetical protein Ga0100230_005965 [Opitutaceae bacterium TAV3]